MTGELREAMRQRALDKRIIRTARDLVALGLTHGTSGNVSARVPDGLRITPTRRRFADLRARDLVTADLDGRVRDGRHEASIELPLHALLLRRRPDVMAVIHTHSPYATALSLDAGPCDIALEEQRYYATGPIAVAPHAPSGSRKLAELAVQALGASPGVLLERHGAVAVGRSLEEALAVAESIEHQARVACIVMSAGLDRREHGPALRRAM